MQITFSRAPERGPTQLMYVGDDDGVEKAIKKKSMSLLSVALLVGAVVLAMRSDK